MASFLTPLDSDLGLKAVSNSAAPSALLVEKEKR